MDSGDSVVVVLFSDLIIKTESDCNFIWLSLVVEKMTQVIHR